jgi:hypothetical protein
MSGSLLFCIIYLASGLRAGWPGFDPQQCKIFHFSIVFRPTVGPTQPPIQWVLGTLSPWVKWPGSEAGHSPPSSAEVKKGGAIPPFPHMSFLPSFWHRVGNFTNPWPMIKMRSLYFCKRTVQRMTNKLYKDFYLNNFMEDFS